MKVDNSAPNFILILVLSLFSRSAIAQSPLQCGGYRIDTAALNAALKYEKENAGVRDASYLVRIYFHICKNDDGSSTAATLSDIHEEFNTLITDYESDNICFIKAGINYIYDTNINFNFNYNNNWDWLDPYLIPNCINVFYVSKITPAAGGVAPVPGTKCLIAKNNIGLANSISHEVGHCLGLLHTFDYQNGYGLEDIDGSNGTSAADLIADTPADPWVYKHEDSLPCFSYSLCHYTGNCSDPKGQSNFSPPYYNIMAYWGVGGPCYGLSFTSDQYARIDHVLDTNPDLQDCESPIDVTFGPGVSISSGYVMKSAISSFETSGNVTLSGTAKVTLGGGTVLLESGFEATPSTGGLILIESSFCSPQYNVGIEDNSLPIRNSITIYPNPANDIITIDLSSSQNSVTGVEIFDLLGRKVYYTNKELSGKVIIDLAEEPSGIYAVKIDMGSTSLSKIIEMVK